MVFFKIVYVLDFVNPCDIPTKEYNFGTVTVNNMQSSLSRTGKIHIIVLIIIRSKVKDISPCCCRNEEVP